MSHIFAVMDVPELHIRVNHAPVEGKCLRFNRHYITAKKENMADKIADIANGDGHLFSTYEEMLEKKYSNRNGCKRSLVFNSQGLDVSINKTRGI